MTSCGMRRCLRAETGDGDGDGDGVARWWEGTGTQTRVVKWQREQGQIFRWREGVGSLCQRKQAAKREAGEG